MSSVEIVWFGIIIKWKGCSLKVCSVAFTPVTATGHSSDSEEPRVSKMEMGVLNVWKLKSKHFKLGLMLFERLGSHFWTCWSILTPTDTIINPFTHLPTQCLYCFCFNHQLSLVLLIWKKCSGSRYAHKSWKGEKLCSLTQRQPALNPFLEGQSSSFGKDA